MNPIAHAELSWLAAQGLPGRRERALVTLAGVLPDLDGLTIVTYPLDGGDAYARWHHLLTHGFVAAVAFGLAGFALAKEKRALTAVLVLATFHLHLVCDLLGSGAAWPIFYAYPFSETATEPFSFGWELDGWQNIVIGLTASLIVLAMGVRFGRTVVEAVSPRADAVLVKTLRGWAGVPSTGA